IAALMADGDPEVAGLAAKIDREEVYHRMHAEMWHERLRDEPRFRKAAEELWPAAVALLPEELRPRLGERVGRELPRTSVLRGLGHAPTPGTGNRHRAHARRRGSRPRPFGTIVLGVEDSNPRGSARPEPGRVDAKGASVLTAEQVWDALREIEDPEIPVISIVDLGVVRDVQVENGTVHVGLTPTFLGCPALEVMRSQMAAKITELGAEPDVQVIRDDAWSSDRITQEGRGKLRAAGFAPP